MTPTTQWKTSMRIQLRLHRDYLLSPHFRNSDYLEQYGTPLRAFLDEILEKP